MLEAITRPSLLRYTYICRATHSDGGPVRTDCVEAVEKREKVAKNSSDWKFGFLAR